MAAAHDVEILRAPSKESPRLSVGQCFLLSLPGLALMLWLFHYLIMHVRVEDFTGFLIGAKLLGTPAIDEVSANLALQKAMTGMTQPGIIFVRMPFWAFAIKPFLHLAYRNALFLWRAIMIICLVACAPLYSPSRRLFALALCSSVTTGACVATGNDVPLILLFLVLSLSCWRTNRHLLAGIFLGLCLAKFNFLIFLPLLLLRRENRRELTGFLLSVTALMAINFAVQPNWISLYWAALNLPQRNMNGKPSLMPNFYATFFWTGHAAAFVAAGAVLLAGVSYIVCCRLPFDLAMPFCIFAALLASPHTNSIDYILSIPFLLAVQQRFPATRALAIFLLCPVAGLLSFLGPPTIGPTILVAASLALICVAIRSDSVHQPSRLCIQS
jgi:hypothetical protein